MRDPKEPADPEEPGSHDANNREPTREKGCRRFNGLSKLSLCQSVATWATAPRASQISARIARANRAASDLAPIITELRASGITSLNAQVKRLRAAV
jgi:hypothetical protein